MPFVSSNDARRTFFAEFDRRNENTGTGGAFDDSRCDRDFPGGHGGRPYQSSRMSDSSCPSECAVCLEELFDDSAPDRENVMLVYQFPCGHFFHYRCILAWASRSNRTCPLCRRPLNVESFRRERGELCDLRQELQRRLNASPSLAAFEYSYSRRWILRVGLAYNYLSKIVVHGPIDLFFYRMHSNDLIAHGLLEEALDCTVKQSEFEIFTYTEIRHWLTLANRVGAALTVLIENERVDAHAFVELRSDLAKENLVVVALMKIIRDDAFDAGAYTLLKSDISLHALVDVALESVIRNARFDPFFLMDEKDNIRSKGLKREALSTVLPQIDFTSYAFQIFRADFDEAGLLPEVLLRVVETEDFTVHRYLEMRGDLWNHNLAATALSNLMATNKLTPNILWRVEEDLRRAALLRPTLRQAKRVEESESPAVRSERRQLNPSYRNAYDRYFVCRRVAREVLSWWRWLTSR
ncbi:hypothetical protein CYMTET_7890 [Cymbomonas tetramitiformis]|uniref:RING-type domain-containing protein n=1 Tax=Cymbomonas tetramitiformis TaxID=36881 RepID=A0AAE0LGE4_9CHLO|nr:hypothetical protein CYMTET_7890 [Cymbomonas tetramitiformis]